MVATWISEIWFARRERPSAKYNGISAIGNSQKGDVESNQEPARAAQTTAMEPGVLQKRREGDAQNAAKPYPVTRRAPGGLRPLGEPDNRDAGFHRPPPVRNCALPQGQRCCRDSILNRRLSHNSPKHRGLPSK